VRIVAWPCPAPGGTGEEFASIAGPEETPRLLIVPALFEEANRTRRLLVQTMRALADAGVASVLPDLPGCNESLAPLEAQDLSSWRASMDAAARHFGARRVLSLRGGALVSPLLPGWRLSPLEGVSVLRQLVRARTISAHEAGRRESVDALLEEGRQRGLDLAGYPLGAAMIRDLEYATAEASEGQVDLSLEEIGGSALWLRSEPGEDAAMGQGLAAFVAREWR
jgi:hypothetical protein